MDLFTFEALEARIMEEKKEFDALEEKLSTKPLPLQKDSATDLAMLMYHAQQIDFFRTYQIEALQDELRRNTPFWKKLFRK